MSLLSLFTALSLLPFSSSTIIGVTYSSSAASPPPPSVSAATATLGLDAVRIVNPNAASVHAFLYSNTSLLLTLPDSLVPAVAANRSAASDWLSAVVLPFFPRAKVAAVSVSDSSAFVLPAAQNLRLALAELGLRGVSVSATFSAASLISSFFPPSAAQFRQPASRNVVVPMLRFLAEANSSFMVSLHPYHVYRSHPEIPIGFALFQEHPFNFRDDLGSGLRYRNLFDIMADAVLSAMAAAGYGEVPLVVAETGWPSGSGDAAEVDANEAYAQLYVRGLVRHLRSPVRKEGGVAAAYVYELFDGGGIEEDGSYNRSWGIMNLNMSAKYDIDFSGGNSTVVDWVITTLMFVWFIFVLFTSQ